jgi:hypothetical protein
MEHRFTNSGRGLSQDRDDAFDLDALLYPAQAFEHPLNVVKDTQRSRTGAELKRRSGSG